jgi:NAD(P)H-dependent FMN reductase
MKDVLIITGTNRQDSATKKVANYIESYLSAHFRTHALDLNVLNDHFPINGQMYSKDGLSPFLKNMQQEILIPAKNWIIVSPEYNGSFQGIIKLWLDALSVSDAAETFHHKKAGLVGVSSGRAGNLRGMDHLTSILNYLHMEVMPYKLPVSGIHLYADNNGNLKPEAALPIEDFCDRFTAFAG